MSQDWTDQVLEKWTALRTDLDMATEVDLRIKVMDDQGIDVEALSINPNWYKVADRDLAIAWPVTEANAVLSERDRKLPSLQAAMNYFS